MFTQHFPFYVGRQRWRVKLLDKLHPTSTKLPLTGSVWMHVKYFWKYWKLKPFFAKNLIQNCSNEFDQIWGQTEKRLQQLVQAHLSKLVRILFVKSDEADVLPYNIGYKRPSKVFGKNNDFEMLVGVSVLDPPPSAQKWVCVCSAWKKSPQSLSSEITRNI